MRAGGRTFWVSLWSASALSPLGARRRWWVRALLVGGAIVAALFKVVPVAALLLGPLILLAGVALSVARVTVGRDHVKLQSVLGTIVLRQADVLAFRYAEEVGRGTIRVEWLLQTESVMVPLGTGRRAQRLVDEMYAQWPNTPRLSDADAHALGGAHYRGIAKSPEELTTMLRMPHLSHEARFRVAEQLAKHGPAFRSELEEAVADTLDDEAREKLRRLL